MNLFCTHVYIIFTIITFSYHILFTVQHKKKEKGVGLEKSFFFSNFFLLLFEGGNIYLNDALEMSKDV